MTKWEYVVYFVYRDDKYAKQKNGEIDRDTGIEGTWGIDVAGTHVDLREALDDIGAGGWEMCSTALFGNARVDDSQKYSTVPVPHFVYFKRPKT